MSATRASEPAAVRPPNEVMLPWLLLLPALCLAWPGPGNPLLGDPFLNLAGTAVVALATLPLAIHLLRRGGDVPRNAFVVLVLVAALTALPFFFGSVTDPFEARRATVLILAGAALFAGGAQLHSTRGRVRFNRILIVLSLVWTGVALIGVWKPASDLTGVLGNTGPLSQAALPGAVVGAWYVTTRRGPWLVLSVLAVGLFLTHAAAAPVLAGALAYLVTLLASGRFSTWARQHRVLRRRFAILIALTVFAFIAFRGVGSFVERQDDAQPEVAAAATDEGPSRESVLGGVEVRARIWSRVPAVLVDHPGMGLGPGQFRAGFPPYRDPVEQSLSSPDDAALTEVEHAHNDALHVLAELGPIGGTLWILFLFLTVRGSLLVLREGDLPLAAQGAAGLAMCVNSLFHCPLTVSPASASIAFALFGMIHAAARAKTNSPPLGAHAARIGGAFVAAGALIGLPLLAHGSALVDYTEAAERIDNALRAAGGIDASDPQLADAVDDARASIDRALEAAPDAAPALLLAARQAPADDKRAAWERVLEVRPSSYEAHYQLGIYHARRGEFDEARERLEAALDLAPSGYAPALRSLARNALLAGELGAGLGYIDGLAAGPDWDPAWAEELAIDLVLYGRTREGLALWPRLDPSFADGNAAQYYASGQAAKDAGAEDRGRALTALAHLLWAREHVADGDPATAVRSYRQALMPTRIRVPGGAASFRFELAAAEILCNRFEDATRSAGALVLDAHVLSELPEWARNALRGAGLGG